MKALALDSIDRMIESKRRRLEQSASIIRDEQQKINIAQAQIEMLEELRQQARDISGQTVDGTDDSAEVQSPLVGFGFGEETKPKPTEAITALLRDHPNGLSGPEIANTLMSKVQTTAKDPRHNLLSSVYNLARKGTLIETGGRYRLTNGQ